MIKNVFYTRFLIGCIAISVSLFAGCSKTEAGDDPDEAPPQEKPIVPYEPSARSSAVKVVGDRLYIGSRYNTQNDVLIEFSKCMFNELMTFSKVGLAKNTGELADKSCDRKMTLVINAATSDNIGPVFLTDHAWFGGNHSVNDEYKVKTAENRSFSFAADGKVLSDGASCYAEEVVVTVKNILFDPASAVKVGGKITEFTAPMCEETVIYTIREGNIEVNLTHTWINETPYNVDTYYGMQSMCAGELIFFPNGQSTNFVNKVNGLSFLKKDYPEINRFVQKSRLGEWYESCYLKNSGLGNHAGISDQTAISFVAYGKTYHRLIAGRTVKQGDSYNWNGVYSYVKPLVEDAKCLAYIIKDASGYTLIADMKQAGKCVISLPAFEWSGFEVQKIDNKLSLADNLAENKIEISATGRGSCFITLTTR